MCTIGRQLPVTALDRGKTKYPEESNRMEKEEEDGQLEDGEEKQAKDKKDVR